MGGVGDGSMSSPPKIEYLPATENDDGIIGVDISSLSISDNPDTVSASVNFVARHYRSKNKELRVKVPREYFSFIAPLWQMGFNKIELAESTYFVLREDKSFTILHANDLQIASGVTVMQRGTIASSSNPCNLICSQTPDATLAVQTPSETACASDWKRVAAGSGDTRVEQSLEFQHSSLAFPSGPAGMGNDNEAAGIQGFSAGPELPVQTKKRPHSANKSKLPSTRTRGPDYGDEAKGLLLQFKLEYLQDPDNKGKPHKWLKPVTEKMKKNGYDRDPVSLRRLWDSIKKSRDAMRRKFPQDAGYWDLTEVEKKAFRKADGDFPLTFEREWDVAMETMATYIGKMDSKSAAEKENQRDGQEGVFSQSLATTMTGSANFAGPGSSDTNIHASVQHPRQASALGSDEDLLVNLQGPGAPPWIQDFVSYSHSLREKDYQEMSFTMEEQVAVQRELTDSALKKSMESRCSDCLGFFDYDDYSVQNSLL